MDEDENNGEIVCPGCGEDTMVFTASGTQICQNPYCGYRVD